MAGIGKYTKKSKGNRGYKMSGPSLLKMVADSKPSPITNEFGIGKGTSPYSQKVQSDAGDPYSYRKTEGGGYEYKEGDGEWTTASGKGLEAIKTKYGGQTNDGNGDGNGNGVSNGNGEGEGEGEDKGKGGRGKNWAKIGVAALTGGLDAVYGSGKIVPAGSARLIKKKKDDKETEDKNTAQSIIDGNRTGAGISANLAPK